MPDNPAKQLPSEQRAGVERALAPAIDELVQVGKYEPPFTAQLTVTLTDANGRTWTAAVTVGDLTSVLSCAACPCVEATAEK